MNDKDEAAVILSIACRNYRILSIINSVVSWVSLNVSQYTLCNLSSKLLTVITSILILIFITYVYYSAAWDHMVS